MNDSQLPSDVLSSERLVKGECLRAVDRRRLLVHSITAVVDELLSHGDANPAGMVVTVHAVEGNGDDDDLLVTATTPHYSVVQIP